MHKLPQPVKLWYLSSFFRRERAQAGRYRQFWQVGAEAIGSDDPAVDAEASCCSPSCSRRLGARGVRLRIASLGSPRARADYRDELQAYLRAHEDELSEEVRGRIDLNPLRAFDAEHAGTQRVMEGAPRLLDRLPADDLEHFAAVRELLDGAGMAYEVDTTLVRGLDYYTRTLFEFKSDALGAQTRRRRRRALRRPHRADRRAADARHGLGRRASSGCCWRRRAAAGRAAPVDLYVAYEARHRGAAFRLAADARRAGHAAQTRTRRPLDEGPAQAGRPRGRPLRCHPGDEGDVAQGHGDGRAETRGRRHGRRATSRGGAVKPPRANELPRRLGRRPRRRARRRDRARRRLGAPPPRPRRPDLHRPARPLRNRPARLPPRDAPARRSLAERLRPEHVLSAAGEVVAPRGGQRQPEPRHGRDRAPRRRPEHAGRRRDAAVPGRRGQPGRRDAAPALPRARPAPRRRCATPSRCATRSSARCATTSTRTTSWTSRRRSSRARRPRARATSSCPSRLQPGLVLRAAAVAAAVQAAADDRRLRALLPDRPLLPRRGPARRPPARVHPARPRDVLRRGGGRHRRDRGR